ncbi:MAG: type II toxin-antitoxin system RelE/ParE family toxin [Streptosporangiaceae bacterium]
MKSSLKCGPGWRSSPTATSAGPTSSSASWPSTPGDLSEPYARHLGGKARELRFHLLRQQTRVTCWPAPGRRVILLTVFRKTRSAETAEVARALQAQKICEAEHGLAHLAFDREVT